MYKLLFAAGLVVAAVAACSSSSTPNTSSSSSSGNGSSSSGSAACVANNTDGQSSCQGHTEPCAASTYCSINICNSGCLTTANCPNGEFCDMSAASTDDALEKPIGICRACPTTTNPTSSSSSTSSSTSSSGSTGACDDVHGAYTMTLDASSSQNCGNVSGECTVTQTGCTVQLSCPQVFAGGSQSVTIDSTDKGTYTGTTTVDGFTVNENCAISFTSTSMKVDCQLTASGGAEDCVADGAKK